MFFNCSIEYVKPVGLPGEFNINILGRSLFDDNSSSNFSAVNKNLSDLSVCI